MPGPLQGYRIVEIGTIGPVPFCAMLLADMGADVIRIKRPAAPDAVKKIDATGKRGIRSIVLDLKTPAGREAALRLVENADALIEGFRPGVMERLGIGPEDCLLRNPRLVFGRMTGWGQTGPLAKVAGHDIDYIAITGALAAIGTRDKPVPPLNLVGDFGSGAMFLAVGVLSGLLETAKSGKGQVVDAAMVDGSALLLAMAYAQVGAGTWRMEREANITDGGSHFYGTYQCSDGKWIAIGAIEPKFYALLLQKMELDPAEFMPQRDTSRWPEWKMRFAEVFAIKTREDWREILDGTDACFAPVLDMHEAPGHPHIKARNVFVGDGPALQPAPAPRFSRSETALRPPNTQAPEQILAELGFSEDEIAALNDPAAAS